MNEIFRTIVDVPPHPKPIGLGEQIVSLGSCFAEHMGEYLAENRFPVCLNPTGILYNPLSIARALKRLSDGESYGRDELFEHNGLWCSFDHHGRFAHVDPDHALSGMNRELVAGHVALRQAGCLILTFGTAFAYFLADDPDRVVANCHRLPAQKFVRRRLGVDDIVTSCAASVNQLRQHRPTMKLILTVSPVRHLRDNPHENLISKSTLALACEALTNVLPDVHYFPAYEIMQDDLRDYRFYEPDMVHPNGVAREYIWQRFQEACLSAQTREFIEAYKPVLKGKNHRFQHACPEVMRTFAEVQIRRLEALLNRFPMVDFQDDMAYFRNFLENGASNSS